MARSLLLRSWFLTFVGAAIGACSGSGSSGNAPLDPGDGQGGSTDGGTDASGRTDASGGGGSGGHGGQDSGGSDAGGGGADGDADGHTDAGDGQAGDGGAACIAGEITCDGGVKRTCDGQGGYVTEDCGANVCEPGLGCVVCRPGSAACDGGRSHVCADDGSGYDDVGCDADLGVTCDESSGRCVGDCSPDALGSSYVGCEYYPTVTASAVDPKFHFAVAVSNTTSKSASIKITRGATTIATATVPSNDVRVITLPWIDALKGPKDSVNNVTLASSVLAKQSAYRLTSTEPVTVYQFSPLEYQLDGVHSEINDASLLLPVNAWTGTYRVAARNSWRTRVSTLDYVGFYAITASADDTRIRITASSTGSVKAGIPGLPTTGSGTITLNRGDVAEVFSATGAPNPEPYDVTGTLIESDKPVQVIGGHQCTFVPHDVSACDHLEESMFPVETLSTSYIVTAPLIPTQTKPKGEMVRIIATAPGTKLTYDPPQPGAPASIAKAGDYVEIANTVADFEIIASEKILVAQYMMGQQAGGGSGDPAMALAVANEQFRTAYLFHAPTNYESNYVNVVALTGAKVVLDGVPVTGFQAIGSSGYGVARVALSNAGNGNHIILGSGSPIGISVYGYGQYTSYWYPGGLDLRRL